MRVFPYDHEMAAFISQKFLECQNNPEEPQAQPQLDYYNDDIMSPFFEQMLGFKLEDIKETILYVSKFFALQFDTTQPEQGDIL